MSKELLVGMIGMVIIGAVAVISYNQGYKDGAEMVIEAQDLMFKMSNGKNHKGTGP